MPEPLRATPVEPLVLKGPENCTVKVYAVPLEPDEPAILQVDDIAVQLTREDVTAIRDYLTAVLG